MFKVGIINYPTGNNFPTDGLISYWKFDEDTGTTAFDSVGSNNLTASSSSILTGVSGVINGCADLRASGRRLIQTISTLLNGLTNATVSGWFYINTRQNEGLVLRKRPVNMMIRTNYNVGGSNEGLYFIINTSNGSFGQIIGNNTYLNTQQWYHLVLVYNGTRLKGYQDGTEVMDIAATGTISSSTDNFIVGTNTNYISTDGLIDEVGIWDRALTSTEITELYNSGNGLQP